MKEITDVLQSCSHSSHGLFSRYLDNYPIILKNVSDKFYMSCYVRIHFVS
jgi:hypothetical protein